MLVSLSRGTALEHCTDQKLYWLCIHCIRVGAILREDRPNVSFARHFAAWSTRQALSYETDGEDAFTRKLFFVNGLWDLPETLRKMGHHPSHTMILVITYQYRLLVDLPLFPFIIDRCKSRLGISQLRGNRRSKLCRCCHT